MVRIVLNQMGWEMSHDDTYDMILRRKDPCSILSCLLFCVHDLGSLRILEHFPVFPNYTQGITRKFSVSSIDFPSSFYL